MYWICTSLTVSGQEITSLLCGQKKDILQQLSDQNLSVVEMKMDYKRFFLNFFPKRRLSLLTLAVFFEDFSNMLETGMSINQAVLILQETCKEDLLKDMLFTLDRQLNTGESLAKSLTDLNVFPWIVSATLSAGERTGKLFEATVILGKYFRNSYQIQNKIKQALIYPTIVFILISAVVCFISLRVIPQLKNLLPKEALHNQTTQFILILSESLYQYLWIFFLLFILGIVVFCLFQRKYKKLFQQWSYKVPLVGGILKESALAIYFLNLSVLLKNGIGLIKSIDDLNMLNTDPVSLSFIRIKEYILGGASFWHAIEQDKFFPTIVSSTLRKAEEMVKMDEYCLSLSEYFDRRVSSKVNGLLSLVQPALLTMGGLFLVMIALGFLVPIYGSLTSIAENP
jgi:type IV pilus assembly protein PilC